MNKLPRLILGPYSLCVQSATSSASHNDLFGCLQSDNHDDETNDGTILIALFHILLLDLKHNLSGLLALLCWFVDRRRQKQQLTSLSASASILTVSKQPRSQEEKPHSLDNDICG